MTLGIPARCSGAELHDQPPEEMPNPELSGAQPEDLQPLHKGASQNQDGLLQSSYGRTGVPETIDCGESRHHQNAQEGRKA